MYFPVSPLKLTVMSVCTFGVYELYWFYKNWCLIKEREKLDIKPFWRALFGVFFCYSCFEKIRTTAQSLNLKESIAAGPLAAGWIIVTLFWRLPDQYWLLTYFAVLFLIPVQILVTKVNATADPGCEENKRFTAWNIAGVVFGGMFLILILLGLWWANQDSSTDSTKRDGSGQITEAGDLGVFEIRIGDCILLPNESSKTGSDESAKFTKLDGVPCTELHDAEIIGIGTLSGDDAFPGDDALDVQGSKICVLLYEEYVGIPYDTESPHDVMPLYPLAASWETGERNVNCLATLTSEEQMGASIRD